MEKTFNTKRNFTNSEIIILRHVFIKIVRKQDHKCDFLNVCFYILIRLQSNKRTVFPFRRVYIFLLAIIEFQLQLHGQQRIIIIIVNEVH